jgi:hypothetical protein
LLVVSETLEMRELRGEILGGAEHHAADLRIGLDALEKSGGDFVGADLGDEEDRLGALGRFKATNDSATVADGVSQTLRGLGGWLFFEILIRKSGIHTATKPISFHGRGGVKL